MAVKDVYQCHTKKWFSRLTFSTGAEGIRAAGRSDSGYTIHATILRLGLKEFTVGQLKVSSKVDSLKGFLTDDSSLWYLEGSDQ